MGTAESRKGVLYQGHVEVVLKFYDTSCNSVWIVSEFERSRGIYELSCCSESDRLTQTTPFAEEDSQKFFFFVYRDRFVITW